MFQLTLVRNREDQPRFVSLVSYVRDGDRVTPVYREWHQGVTSDPQELACTRIKLARWRDIKRPDVPLQPTIRTTTRESLIASGHVRPTSAGLTKDSTAPRSAAPRALQAGSRSRA